MAPKVQPGKKGQVDQEDFSDVPTLPLLNSYLFTILYNSFFSQETRERLQKYIHEHLPADRVKTLTREEIITYGKTKQIILEPNVAATLPQDDPRLKMNEQEQLAKAATDKLFEMSVHARRAKKEKIQKMEEEVKLQQQLDPKAAQANQLDPDQLDVMFQIIDFPNTKAEATAFAKLNNTLHCIYEINQQLKVADGPEEEEEIQQRGQETNQEQESESKQQTNVNTRLNFLKEARQYSDKSSILRHLSVIKFDFINWALIDYKINEQGEEVEKREEPEVKFSQEFNYKLEHYGALYIKYLRFREKVPILPLAPDRDALSQMEQVNEMVEDYKHWLHDAEQFENMNQTLKDQMAQSNPDEYNQRKREIEEQKNYKKQELEQKQREIQELKERLKVSQDDKYYMKNYNLDSYKNQFVNNIESQNSITSIMSAMVSQIENENRQYHYVYEMNTQPTTIEEVNIFQDILNFSEEINFSAGTQSRVYQDVEQTIQAEGNCYNRQRRVEAAPLGYGNNEQGLLEYNEDTDKLKAPIYRLGPQVTQTENDIAEYASIRELNALNNLVLPGVNRELMPPIPSKSERIRNNERSQLYPFCTLPIEDVERALVLKAFQELLKTNQVDQPLKFTYQNSKLQQHPKYKMFERIYQYHMTPEILKQVLSEALLHEPDMTSLYYPRDDSLLLALYNKANSGERHRIDGQRLWRAAYRVMPDFENWIKYFAEELVIPVHQQSMTQDNNKIPIGPLKYQWDEEMLPDSLLDIDDQKISNIQETSEMLYPYEGSVIKVDTFTVGEKTYKKSKILKDNLIFGLRTNNTEEIQNAGEEKEFGLFTYKRKGGQEFWMHFENDAKLLVERIDRKRNPQRLIRKDPPKPTPEEIAAREEAIKAAQAAAAKQKGRNASALANVPIIEEYKEPEPTWEPEPFDDLDNQFQEDQEMQQSQSTITFPNGLIVKHLSNGNIVQLTEEQVFNKDIEEIDREYLFDSNGAVIRHLRNKDAEILFASGVKSYFSRKDMMWIITNNKGIRTAKKSGIQWDLDPIPCSYETDAVTNAKMMIREDKVMTIQYKDGSLYCQHADGTTFKTNSDGTEIRIEKDGLAPVTIKKNFSRTNESPLIAQNRCADDKRFIFNTYLPDGTIVETYLYKEGYSTQIINHLYHRPDFSCVYVNSEACISIVSSNLRSAFNELNQKTIIGQDTSYLGALLDHNSYENVYKIKFFGSPEECNTAFIELGNSALQEYYKMNSDYTLQRTQDSYNSIRPEYIDHQAMNDYANQDKDIEEIGGQAWDPYSRYFISPRLFVIKSDGSGYELCAKQQLEYYFRTMKHQKESIKQRKVILAGSAPAKSHFFITKVKTLNEKATELTQLKSIEFPQNSIYALLHLKEKQKQPEGNLLIPKQYLFRQIFEFQELEEYKQEHFLDDLARFKQWKQSQGRYDSEFGIIHIPAKDQVLDYKQIERDEFFAKRIITRILKERRNKRKEFIPVDYEYNFIKDSNSNVELNEYFRRVTTEGREDISSMRNHTLSKNEQSIDSAPGPERYGISMNALEAQNQEKIKNIKKKQQAYIQNQLSDIRRMVNTPSFIPSYFQSKSGQQFTKNNPEKPPSQEMLMRMSQRINRSQQNTEKGQSHYDGQSQSPKNDNFDERQNDAPPHEGEEKESPIVALEPEDQLKQGSAFMGGSKRNANGQGSPTSLYLQEKMYLKQREQEQLLKSEEYHVVKTKDFNVYGRLRQDKPFVKVIQKSQATAELNEKFITTECIADRRIKISSMAPRQYINAPSIEDVRKQGQHQMILSAINKKQTFAELINQANAMVTSVLHDPLKRTFNIMPSALKYGTLCAGQPYEIIITMKNEDQIAQRATVKPLNDKRIKVEQVDTGAIAPGMTKKISVTILCEEECTIKEQLQILTKTDIFKIPIEATVLSPDNYQKELQEQKALNGRTLQNSRVRNKLNQSIQKGRMSAKSERMIMEGDGDQIGGMDWIQTTNSDSKLPVIPQVNNRPFQVDPKKNLKELLPK